MTKDIRRALESRRGDVERQREVTGGLYTVEGTIACVGTGEATLDVKFPVTFLDRPRVYANGGASDNQRIVPGEFPTWNAGVLWFVRVEDPQFPDSPLYVGARLIVVISGAIDDEATFESEIWWMARGKALTNPTTGGL